MNIKYIILHIIASLYATYLFSVEKTQFMLSFKHRQNIKVMIQDIINSSHQDDNDQESRDVKRLVQIKQTFNNDHLRLFVSQLHNAYQNHEITQDNLVTILKKSIKYKCNILCIALFKKYKYMINYQDEHNNTFCMHTITYRNHTILTYLLNNKAKLDLENEDGHQPLHHACACNNIYAIKMLIKKGASLYAHTYDGDTPLACAVQNSQVNAIHVISLIINARIRSS
jgi:ankyrin repeat protein